MKESIVDQAFGRLTVKEETDDGWARCECAKDGVVHKKNHWVLRNNLLSGGTNSCGCLRSEKVTARMRLVMSNSGDPDADTARAVAMRSEGNSYTKIGKAIGVSRQRAHQMCKEAERAKKQLSKSGSRGD